MLKTFLTLSMATAILLTGCGSSSDTTEEKTSTLSPEVKESLAYMGNEERLAYDIYNTLYEARGRSSTVESLDRIASKAEIKHIEAVQAIVKKYNIDGNELSNVVDPVADKDTIVADMPEGKYDIVAIQNLYDTLYALGKDSDKGALEVACMVEVTDIDDLDKYIVQAENSDATDIVETFNFLRDGSYNHYWAFDTALINLGIPDGCCSLGETYCHPEYPKHH